VRVASVKLDAGEAHIALRANDGTNDGTGAA
jgi:hypothetical protein